MFGLFSSPRKRAIKKAHKLFQTQFPELCQWDDAKIGAVLDVAVEIKRASLDMYRTGEWDKIFTTPSQVPEAVVVDQIEIFDLKITEWIYEAIAEANQEKISFWKSKAHAIMQERRAGLCVWYFSLAAGCFTEFRPNGVLLWNQLRRGYPHAKLFVPGRDAVAEFNHPA